MPLDKPRQFVGVVGKKQPRLFDDVPIARILERLGAPTREVEEVGSRMDVDPLLPDVGIEPEDQSLVFAGLEAWMLRESAAAVRRPDQFRDVGDVGVAPSLEFQNDAVVSISVVSGEENVDPRSARRTEPGDAPT
jgi:hypothetical protein